MNFTDIRRRIIVALVSDDTLFDQLVLKGGNAISLIYGFGNRASLDLDFSIENDFKDLEDSKRRIFTALEEKFGEIGFTVFDKKFSPRPQRGKPNIGEARLAGLAIIANNKQDWGRRRDSASRQSGASYNFPNGCHNSILLPSGS